MKKSTSFAVLVAGILVALLVGVIAFEWLQKRTTAQTQAAATQPVIVAAVNLTWGKVLDAMQVKTVLFLKSSLPQGHFSQVTEVQGRTLLYPVREGEPLFESQLAPTSVKVGGVSALISPSKRAMAVKVDKVIGVSGYVNPGNRVDVLVTINQQTGDKQSPVTKTVIENVLVLAAGAEVEKTGKQEKPTPVDVITLEVTPEEGEKLALAATEGKVLLALRNPTDMGEVATKGATIPVLLASLGVPAPVRRSAPVYASTAVGPAAMKAAVLVDVPKRPMFVVQVTRGTVVSEYKFEKGE